jgi:hypothetical protein
VTPVRALGLVLLLAGGAAAHWIPPEAIVARLNAPSSRALGVERAARDEKAARLLVIHVRDPWYALPVERRRAEAAQWLRTWRQSVPEGIVAVLDADTERPVVHFAPGGRVSGVSDRGR